MTTPPRLGTWYIKDEREHEADNPGPRFDNEHFDQHSGSGSNYGSGDDENQSESEAESGPVYQQADAEDTNTFYMPGKRATRQAKKKDEDKKAIVILSNIISALRPRVDEVACWEADVVALQETKLGLVMQHVMAAKLRQDGWQAVMGKLTKVQATTKKVAMPTNAAR